MRVATADLSDAHPEAKIAESGLLDFGGRSEFSGFIRTVRCHEDNSLVRAALEGQGDGAVLVVDGGGSRTCALLGDRLGALAIVNGWSGVVVNGCVRDTADLGRMDLGVRALAAHPRRSLKQGRGEMDVSVSFLGVDFVPGQWIYVDSDGLLILPERAPED
jgi:regulator of ribonuclease activity A